jgi:hypothetical protein
MAADPQGVGDQGTVNHEIGCALCIFYNPARTPAGLDFGFGSIPAAELRGRHGRTCFDTGRQGTQPLCMLLIHAMAVAIKGKRRARSTSVTGRHGRRPWHLQPEPASRAAKMSGTPPYVNADNRCNFIHKLPAGPAAVPPINCSVCAVGRQVF